MKPKRKTEQAVRITAITLIVRKCIPSLILYSINVVILHLFSPIGKMSCVDAQCNALGYWSLLLLTAVATTMVVYFVGWGVSGIFRDVWQSHVEEARNKIREKQQ